MACLRSARVPWSLVLGRARAVGGQLHALAIPERNAVPVPERNAVPVPERKPPLRREKRDPGEPQPWWRQMRDPKMEDLKRVNTLELTEEELSELAGRTQWADAEEGQCPLIDPVIEARHAKLLKAYVRVLDDLAVVEGREAPSSSDRQLLFDMDYTRQSFYDAYGDRVRCPQEGISIQNSDLNLWTDAASDALEEVIAELEQRIAAATIEKQEHVDA